MVRNGVHHRLPTGPFVGPAGGALYGAGNGKSGTKGDRTMATSHSLPGMAEIKIPRLNRDYFFEDENGATIILHGTDGLWFVGSLAMDLLRAQGLTNPDKIRGSGQKVFNDGMSATVWVYKTRTPAVSRFQKECGFAAWERDAATAEEHGNTLLAAEIHKNIARSRTE